MITTTYYDGEYYDCDYSSYDDESYFHDDNYEYKLIITTTNRLLKNTSLYHYGYYDYYNEYHD